MAGSILGLLHHAPCQRTMTSWTAQPQLLFRVWCAPRTGDAPPLSGPGFHRHFVRVFPEGSAWLLGEDRAEVIAEDISGHRVAVMRLRSHGTVFAACSPNGGSVVYIDSALPGLLRYADTSGVHSLERLESVWGAKETIANWTGARLAVLGDSLCVLTAPGWDQLLIIDGTRRIATIRLRAPHVSVDSRSNRWTFIPWWQSRRGPPPDPPVAAMTANGFFAVLAAGLGGDKGRLVDLYTVDGRYHGTLALPWQAEHVGAELDRLLVLGRREGQWWVAILGMPQPVK